MDNNIWARFETIAKPEEVEQAKKQFDPIDPGEYTAVLEKLEAGETQSGLPALKSQWRTTENRVIFTNMTLQSLTNPEMTATNIAKAVRYLSALIGEEIEYTGLGALAELVSTFQTGGTYTIKVSYGSKDLDMKYPNVTVVSDPF